MFDTREFVGSKGKHKIAIEHRLGYILIRSFVWRNSWHSFASVLVGLEVLPDVVAHLAERYNLQIPGPKLPLDTDTENVVS